MPYWAGLSPPYWTEARRGLALFVHYTLKRGKSKASRHGHFLYNLPFYLQTMLQFYQKIDIINLVSGQFV